MGLVAKAENRIQTKPWLDLTKAAETIAEPETLVYEGLSYGDVPAIWWWAQEQFWESVLEGMLYNCKGDDCVPEKARWAQEQFWESVLEGMLYSGRHVIRTGDCIRVRL